MSTSDAHDRLSALVAGPVEALGLDLEAVELSSAGKRRVLRVAVDRDGGATMDDIAEATRAISAVLDGAGSADADAALGSQPYTLEVSSRGVDRPLTLPRHWRRNVDRLVKVDFNDETAAVTGRIAAADETGATLLVDGEEHRVEFDAVKTAKVQIEFKREG